MSCANQKKSKAAKGLPGTGTRAVFRWQIENRAIMLALLLVVTGFFGYFASGVSPDHSVEYFFPTWSEARRTYDRYKESFPHEDTHAFVIVKDPDIFSREGLASLEKLEKDLATLPHVMDIVGPMSVPNIGDGKDFGQELLFPGFDIDEEEIRRKKMIATEDPLLRWNLFNPDGTATVIRLTLDPEAVFEDRGRQEYHQAAKEMIREHQRENREILLSGLPSIRAKFAEGVGSDLGLLVPLALVVVVLLMFGIYRSAGASIGCLITIIVSLVWATGFQGMLGYSITILSSILPVLVIVISVSDTAHIVNDFFERRRRGINSKEALIDASSRAAWPCFATELVIAIGFLSLLAVNIVGVMQFGLSAAGAMILTWAANMTVMPLVMSFVRTDGRIRRGGIDRGAPRTVRAFEKVVDFIGQQAITRSRRVLVIAALIAGISALMIPSLDRNAYVFDDLFPGSDFYMELRSAESVLGGLVPVAIFVEMTEDEEDPALDPEVIRLMDRAGNMLRDFPEFSQALSIADFIRKVNVNRLMANERYPDSDGLPDTRALLIMALSMAEGAGVLRDYIRPDNRSVAAVAFGLDAGSARFEEMFHEIDAWVKAEQQRFDNDPDLPELKISVTGQMHLFHEVHSTLTGGLFGSLGGIILITLIMFFIVFRSFGLGLIGLVPNIMPILLTVAFMVVAGISLRPMTVIVFSIILVIAYDDTVQFLTRLRRNYADILQAGKASEEIVRTAIIATLRETGLPLFITSTIVSAGFLLLVFSSFLGVAQLGMVLCVTLFFALFADLFLAPILVEKFRPTLGPNQEQYDITGLKENDNAEIGAGKIGTDKNNEE